MMFGRIIAALTLAVLLSPAWAGALVKTDLDPIDHATAALTVVAPDGATTVYTPAELERFTTYRLTTTTPWRDAPAAFDGVLLSDILDANGLGDTSVIVVTAENDYSTTLERNLLESVEILVATRVDGRPHSRRARGPIQFVLDQDAFTASDLTSESNLVWMASRIEAGK